MSTRLLGFALAAATLLAAASAHAVEIRNEDDQAHEIIVSVWKDQTTLETIDTVIQLNPGDTVSGVCDTCIVSVGKSDEAESAAAEGTQVVTVIKGGKLRVD